MSKHEGEIRIYVACLAAYNNGILYGAWIDAAQPAENMCAAIADMLKASPIEHAEEYAIHDYEGFGGVELEEYTGINEVAERATFIASHGALGAKLVAYCGNVQDARGMLEEGYAGEYHSLADFAQELTEQTTEIPESLRYYIDYDAMARDLEINDVTTIETAFEEVHVFWQC